jgi:hypothetical protein
MSAGPGYDVHDKETPIRRKQNDVSLVEAGIISFAKDIELV